MICISCDGKTKVFDTVTAGEHVYRKRKCAKCGDIFITTEHVALTELFEAKVAFSNKWTRKAKQE